MPSRRSLSIRPVHSEKVETTFSHLQQDSSSVQNVTISFAEKTPTVATDIETGATIPWIFFELNFAAETITNPKIIHWILWKNPQGSFTQNPAVPDPITKKWILKRGMEMLPKNVATVTKRIGVIRIPRGMKRQADNDTMQLSYVVTSAETVNVCGIFIYKWFS